MEKLTADDLQLERIRLETLSDHLKQTLGESRSIRELIEEGNDRQRVDVTDHEHTHAIQLWVSTHDNGWEAWVTQHDDWTFTAWACRATENPVAIYIEDSFEHGCAAASFDLGRLSRHEACGPNCTTWQER